MQVNIGSLKLAANHNIRQIVEVCEEHEKEEKLMKLLKDMANDANSKMIIFVETKKKVDDITKAIRREGYTAIAIHGDKSQPERDYVLTEFRNGKSAILVATDVAARGLDVEDVKYVLNYDYPNSSEDYVHRIGRTGRCQQAGTAYAFFTSNNQRQAKDLISVLEEAGQIVNANLQELASATKNSQSARNRWQNRNKDNSSPNSNNSGSNNKTKTWINTKALEYKPNPNGGKPVTEHNFTRNSENNYNRNPRNNYHNQANGYVSSYHNSQYQSGQTYHSGYGQVNTYSQNGPNRPYGKLYK